MIDRTIFPITNRFGDPAQPEKPDKGKFNGSCNRRACQQPDATWINHGNNLFYCGPCGVELNRWNRDWKGGPMCEDVAKRDPETGEITGRHDVQG